MPSGIYSKPIEKYTVTTTSGSKPCRRLLLHLETKTSCQNVETQHKHIYSYYIGSLYDIAFSMALLAFSCIFSVAASINEKSIRFSSYLIFISFQQKNRSF